MTRAVEWDEVQASEWMTGLLRHALEPFNGRGNTELCIEQMKQVAEAVVEAGRRSLEVCDVHASNRRMFRLDVNIDTGTGKVKATFIKMELQ